MKSVIIFATGTLIAGHALGQALPNGFLKPTKIPGTVEAVINAYLPARHEAPSHHGTINFSRTNIQQGAINITNNTYGFHAGIMTSASLTVPLKLWGSESFIAPGFFAFRMVHRFDDHFKFKQGVGAGVQWRMRKGVVALEGQCAQALGKHGGWICDPIDFDVYVRDNLTIGLTAEHVIAGHPVIGGQAKYQLTQNATIIPSYAFVGDKALRLGYSYVIDSAVKKGAKYARAHFLPHRHHP
jgi:hypothetical protein